MTDNELRGKLLKELYDNRLKPWTQVGLKTVRITEQLNQHKLLTRAYNT